ncbi:Vesicle-associated protein 1-2 [Heracleum sosnowskyi]|uniref:Vesicle-associated protein 1-2 n=1 Tax=Heracleum sosnowskyi TaxID=360622 RepID=A0AAD8I9U2_9APIA|nr:Vesicle-associated protein 1-2 [Heracleum sosnowskyi]
MSTGELLNIEPRELKFTFELRKQISSSLTLINKTDKDVAFKVKTTNPKKYCVRPNTGVVLPGSTCDVTVTMQAQKEAPPDMHCKDKFLLQSVVASTGAIAKDITTEMFSREAGNVVEECKLRVLYVSPTHPPSSATEGSEDGCSPRASHLDYVSEASPRSFVDSLDKSSEVRTLMLKLNEEKTAAIQQGDRLRRELELLVRSPGIRNQSGVSVKFVAIVGLISILVGYLMKRT